MGPPVGSLVALLVLTPVVWIAGFVLAVGLSWDGTLEPPGALGYVFAGLLISSLVAPTLLMASISLGTFLREWRGPIYWFWLVPAVIGLSVAAVIVAMPQWTLVSLLWQAAEAMAGPG